MSALPTSGTASAKTSAVSALLGSATRLLVPLAALLVLTVFFTARTDGRFLGLESLGNIVDQASIFVIVGVAQTIIIIAGGIDLSVGAVVAFTGTAAAVLMLNHQVPPAAAAVLGVLAGGVVGFLNGWVTVKTRLHPFIVTLGSLMIFRGLALALTNSQSTSLLPEQFTGLASGAFPLGDGHTLLVPRILLWYIVGVSVAVYLLLAKTRMGRYCFAIGSNAEAARLSGVRVDRWVTLYFTLAGLLFGFAGIVQAARIHIGQPTVAEGMELDAVAAAVIGGSSLSGGRGSVAGTVLGAFLMASLRQGLRMLNLAPHWQTVALGAAIIAAVVYDRASRNRSR